MCKIDIVKEKIRENLPLSEVVSLLTGQRIHKGKWLCPFHDDKTPSMSISDKKNVFYCFSCGTGGDIFTFVMLYTGLTLPDVVKYLDKEFELGFIDQEFTWEQKQEIRRKKEERREKELLRERLKKEYHSLCQDYRICNLALYKLEKWSPLWCYYLEERARLECRFNELEIREIEIDKGIWEHSRKVG